MSSVCHLSNQCFRKYFFKSLFKIGFDVFYVFYTHADAHLVGCYTGALLFGFTQLLVRSRCRANGECFCIAYIGQVAYQA